MTARAPMDPHLDPDTLAAYADGRLARAELELANRHIDACGSCRSELSALAALVAPPEPLDGGERVLGRYRVIGELGDGSHVRAYDPELARPVRIEQMRDVDREQLRADAGALARLRHPNIAGVFEVFGDGEATYLVTELVEGPTLRAWCQGRSPREILDACIVAGRALAAAHDAGVAQRELKPDSVRVGADGVVRWTELGLGRREPAPPRADQYSFCLAVHELLTGVRPGTGRAPGSVTLAASLPRQIARVLRRGLARDPAARFGSLHALLDALVAEPAVRRRWLLAAAVAAAIATVALAVIAAW